MGKRFHRQGFPVPADAESSQAFFQITGMPDSRVVIAAFQDMAEVENDGFEL